MMRRVTEGPISAGRRWNEVRGRTVLRDDDAAKRFPDQSARGAGRAGASLYEGGFPPRETKLRRRDPAQEGPWNIKVAKPSGLAEGNWGRGSFGSRTEQGTGSLDRRDGKRRLSWCARIEDGFLGLRAERSGHEHRQILRSAQWGLAAMPGPISFGATSRPGLHSFGLSRIQRQGRDGR